MEKEHKYWLREKNIPYYYEDVITRGPSMLKMFEVFDGKDVKWGIREDYVKITDKKYCRSSPLFENMQYTYGYDKERIIYLDNQKFIIHGKLNGSEVLCQINDNDPLLNYPLVNIQDFGGEEVRISEQNKELAFVKYKENGLDKCLYFNYKDFSPCSNIFDIIYANNCFLKSYQIGDKSRLFVGRVNSENGEVKPVGFDVNKREYFDYPLDDDNKIDEEEMMNYLKNDEFHIGINTNVYRVLERRNLILALSDLNVLGYDVISNLIKYNRAKVKRK